MPIYARCDRCRKRLLPGSVCACMQQQQKATRREKETRPEYGTQNWKTKRAAALARYHHIDVLVFYRTGQIVSADMVHHIEPLKDAPELWLGDDNLIPLSNGSHALVEAAYDDPQRRQAMQRELRAAVAHFRAVFQFHDDATTT